MKTCNLVKDLIPLYVEELANEDSAELVKNHITECAECRSYYEMIKQDYEEQKAIQPDDKQLDRLMGQLAGYQQKIKLAGVMMAMLMSSIIHGAGVQFLSTIPFLILVPFVCRLYYGKSWPILLSSIGFGIIGGLLSENHSSSYIPFFTVMTFLTSITGVLAAVLIKSRIRKIWRPVFWIISAALLFASCMAFFSLSGNPVGYVQAMVKSKDYVNKTYEEGVLSFKGVVFNFKDKRHYGQFEYVLNGVRQTATIGFDPDGQVDDYYKYVLESLFLYERSADMKTEITAEIDFSPVAIDAKPASELNITEDEINDRYYHLSYDPERRNKATALRRSESAKLSYEISFGPFSEEYDKLSKEQFIDKAAAILNTLQARQVPFYSIQVKALDPSGSHLQSISFSSSSSIQQLKDSYTTQGYDIYKK